MQLLKEMEKYAQEENVPIINQEGLLILKDLILEYKPKSILEIGTAIGYSALNMHLIGDLKVTTIERDEKMYGKAVEYIGLAKLNNKINLIYADALLFDNSKLEKVDMLYIDASKGQYIKFFEKYVTNVNEGGVIIFDNLLFHGFVKMEQKDIKNRNTRQLIRKLKEFLEYIQNHPDYDFTLIEEGDGIGVAKRKESNG